MTPNFAVNVCFQNVSSVVTAEELTKVVAALEVQVQRDFGPVYGVSANLPIVTTPSAVGPKDWMIVVGDDSDAVGALGYHELTSNGQPLGKVFAKTDKEDGLNWSVTASHELLEMLGDPVANLLSLGSDGQLRAYEVCDAVEDDSLGYEVDGGFGEVLVSDFVLPAWFDSTPGPYDFCGKCDAPLKLLPGGYIGVYKNGVWTQITQTGKRTDRLSRRFGIRISPRTSWRPSVFNGN